MCQSLTRTTTVVTIAPAQPSAGWAWGAIATVAERIVVSHNVDVTDDHGQPLPIYCFIRMNYTFKVPEVASVPRPPAGIRPQMWLDLTGEITGATVVESGTSLQTGQVETG